MGFAVVGFDRHSLDDIARKGTPFHDYWRRTVDGVPEDAEFVGWKLVHTQARIYLAYKHPSFTGEWRDDYASMDHVYVTIEAKRVDESRSDSSAAT